MIAARAIAAAVLLAAAFTALSPGLLRLRAEGMPGTLRMEIVRREDGRILWHTSVEAGERFEILFRHSSDHTPVCDLFEVTAEGGFLLLEERFLWYGAGLEFHPSAEISFPPEGTRVHLRRPFPAIPLRAGLKADHRLQIRGRQIPLLEIARGGESLWIRIGRAATGGP
ncbi:MAG: DUF1850 domain-containing protein [Desulfobacterales bacterium]